MALTYPLSRSVFMDTFKVYRGTFALPEAIQTSETAGGEVLTADYGPRLWRGSIQLIPSVVDEAEVTMALIRSLGYAGRKFEVYDTLRTAPQKDPDGTTLGAATPTILATPSAREIRLQGLPVGYEISAGDKLTVVTASTSRVVLFRVVTGDSAGGVGETGPIEVQPNVPASVAAGDPVTLVKPYCMAMVVPGSVKEGMTRGGVRRDMAFEWRQTL